MQATEEEEEEEDEAGTAKETAAAGSNMSCIFSSHLCFHLVEVQNALELQCALDEAMAMAVSLGACLLPPQGCGPE
jgi:hypothetical protein